MLCDKHPAGHHFDGETCVLARDLKTGDRLTALGGGAEVIVRNTAPHEDPGWTSVLLDVSCDGYTAFRSDTVLSVRRPDPEPEGEDDAPDVTVTVKLSVTETVTYEFQSEVEIPAAAVDDPDALHDFLSQDEGQWLDDLDPTGAVGCLYVNERTLDEAALVLTA